MKKRILSMTLLALFSVALLTESGFAGATPYPISQTTLSPNKRDVAYSTSTSYQRRRSTTKTRTALRIAAPAAIGAGVGALAGGKKGAAVGALLGGGGGALYHLYKSRR
ncbi:MAG TPA: hypothetical protein VFZ34_10590 [Blastocatellia bacterium]|nr:hypothetical protein [Blastocatellia bacterium]